MKKEIKDTNLLTSKMLVNFDRRNTKIGSIKWTRTFFRGKRRTVKVIINRIGQLVSGDNMFHGIIKATRERLVIYKYGADGRFWGACYHTKEAADEYGW